MKRYSIECFIQNASDMTTEQVADFIISLTEKKCGSFKRVMMESFKKRCTPAIFKIIDELSDDMEDQKRCLEIIFDGCDQDTKDDIYEMIGQVEADAAQTRSDDDRFERSRGL